MDDLNLCRPTEADVADLHVIVSDPRVWTHYPSLRPSSIDQTRSLVNRWMMQWEVDGLGPSIVRNRDSIIGYGGCDRRRGAFWNLGYRLAADVQGRGLATMIAQAAVDAARRHDDSLPVVAYLVEHNRASARVAEKVGLSLVHRAPDAGNPDPTVIRLVFADRPLTAEELSAVVE
ncbi:GCN5-related N-acetyltransferase OS=Tsukamurella paurometabola (strain ATCC 8368 / DSM / CCUG 35730 / CIP 100753 / JCM 10117 / KCTC 9821 / NBRC 16120 /NCIMB 702349 / NCTC 13040) OX=521096 GN=Tpau_0540 PE=4 SV=1 [Tsukamurella paurometabola]|uniref:GCN5-related N-acetyltransferase n=1 Tax=Tsukamurella paurometabola (strain ATCC 8368 / DSM 20162 / CCUG 35730 / CIP 100753 / JCM 10117 / KCTC 9821 / NBRC 16120 / NCIMB 702349 / NCTC 13040) TaxID=521096 RepID=D5USB4_TSUPD|nr:GNAT family N-acetyltransferase [Tsukamurella paurometabola]ADG77181.1 GCN5-related N-acetyltransferase [Tsukamurella paurometabola DSM 20162]SUP43074.1 Uncharacterised protein [Tsukamurella paurometabola]